MNVIHYFINKNLLKYEVGKNYKVKNKHNEKIGYMNFKEYVNQSL